MSYFDHKLFDILIDCLPTDESNHLAQIMSNDDVAGLVSLSVDRTKPVLFSDVFFKELFRKVSDAPLGIDTAVVAVSDFLSVEKENVNTNERIRNLSLFIKEKPGSDLSILIDRIQKQISKILGPVPHPSLTFTFGATFDLKRNRTVFRSCVNPTVTQKCLSFLRDIGEIRSDYDSCFFPIEDNPGSPFGSVKDDFIVCSGAKLDTVPKTAKTDRVIAKECTVNIGYQAGVGRIISNRLKNFGLDIGVRASIHKEMARQASIDGQLATIDLSAASDRIVTELVRLLLPPEWFVLLDSLRSEEIQINDAPHKLQMFSSAGNGFTFELETLIFYSISLAISYNGLYYSAPHDISVFGDDIILPGIFVDQLSKCFNIFGFVINKRKSFNEGFFRESCGGDFYKGQNVRGYNVKRLPLEAHEWISICNAVRRVCYYNNSSHWRARWCSDLWHRIVSSVPEDHLLFGPRHYGDTCINCEYPELYTIRSNKWSGEYIKVHLSSGGEFTTVGREISDTRVSGNLAGRLVSHESLRDHGLRWQRVKGEDDVLSYPETILTSSISSSYRNRWVPYTLFGQAPEDLDTLIDGLTSSSAQFLRTPRLVVARSVSLRHQANKDLHGLLMRMLSEKRENSRIAVSLFDSFSFEAVDRD